MANTKKIEQKDNIEQELKIVDFIEKTRKKYLERTRLNTLEYYYEVGLRLNYIYGKPSAVGHANTVGFDKKREDSVRSIQEKLKERGIRIDIKTLYQARLFAEKYDLKEVIKEEDISWTKIRATLKKKVEGEDKKEKGEFDYQVLKFFNKWKKFSNDFYNAIPKVDFVNAPKEKKVECVLILKNTINQLNKRIKQIEDGKI